MGKAKPELCVVEALATGNQSRQWLELKIVELAHGIVSMLQESTIMPSQACAELFNLDNYDAVRRLRLHADVSELFMWGMELMGVEKHVPHALDESYAAMEKLITRVMRRGMMGTHRRRAKPIHATP